MRGTHQAMYGLRRPFMPKRLTVESEIQPIMGSVMTSKERARAVKKDRKASPAPRVTAWRRSRLCTVVVHATRGIEGNVSTQVC